MSTSVKKPDDDAKAAEVKRDPRDGEPISIDPQLIAKNIDGFHVSADWFVRLPVGIETAQEVHDLPGLWRRVQGSPAKSMRKFDRVRLTDNAESFLMIATVVRATENDVVLGGISIITLPPRQEVLPGDDIYQVEFEHGGYRLYRRADHCPMGGLVYTLAEAVMALHHQYPKTA